MALSKEQKKMGGGMMMKKPVAMGNGGKMPMVKKGGKSVPSFAADGVGKMSYGGKMPKKMEAGGKTKGPSTKMYKDKKDKRDLALTLAAYDKFNDRGKSGEKSKFKRYRELARENIKNDELLAEYGKDAPKARTFMTEKQPDKKSYGGKMPKKMNMGGKCRGMGAATRGGNFKMG